MNKNIVYYIEDKPSDLKDFFERIAKEIADLEFRPIIENQKVFLKNVQDFLDPIGDTNEEKVINKEFNKKALDQEFENTFGFIIDYELEGENKSGNVNGCRFYEEYVLKNNRLKDSNILFLTHFRGKQTGPRIKILNKINDDYINGVVRLLTKDNFTSPTTNTKIINTITELFLSPNF
jgi:hypothetical protein